MNNMYVCIDGGLVNKFLGYMSAKVLIRFLNKKIIYLLD